MEVLQESVLKTREWTLNNAVTPKQVVADHSASVEHLITVLVERIRAGVYLHGHWLPSERALSDEFSVCRPTVRQALAELENRGLLRRTARHRPVVWNTGSHADMARHGNIGLWVAGGPGDYGPNAIARAVGQTLGMDGPRLVVAYPYHDSQERAIRSETDTILRLAEAKDIAGLILWHLGGESNRDALETFRAQGKPLIFVDRRPPLGFDADYVGVDNHQAAADAVRHLIRLGHRHIVHITNSDHASSVRERLDGYRTALEEARIPYRPEYVLNSDFFVMASSDQARHWSHIVAEFLNLPDHPTAVFALNDYSAFSMLYALRDAGKRVPEDVALVGFDDSDRWWSRRPFMTSISQPFENIGVEAVCLLQERLTAGGGSYRHILLPAPLVIRESSGCRKV